MNSQTDRRPRACRHTQGNTQNAQDTRGRPLADNIDTRTQLYYGDQRYSGKITYRGMRKAVRVRVRAAVKFTQI